MKALQVLIIEDQALTALLFAEVLGELGHEVCASVRTEAAAIAAASQMRPELIIADVHLQDGSGLSAVNSILKTGFIPHIFVSGDELDRRLLHPSAGVLQKPFHERQLINAIQHALSLANVAPFQWKTESLGTA
jgi:two-component system, response regulator PdtaR